MRLVASGCSMTYGHGLQDCFIPPVNPGKVASKLAWPSITAKLLGRECINVSRPGGSNANIIKSILEIDLKKTDTVTILWSFLTRDLEYKPNSLEHYGEWDKDYIKTKLKYSNAFDIQVRSLINIYNFTKYLETQQVQIHYQFVDPILVFDQQTVHSSLLGKLVKGISKYDYTVITFDQVQRQLYSKTNGVNYALDKSHPNEIWHNNLGTLVYNTLTAKTNNNLI